MEFMCLSTDAHFSWDSAQVFFMLMFSWIKHLKAGLQLMDFGVVGSWPNITSLTAEEKYV